MDLPVIGSHCEHYRCGDLDLLPIRCNGCQRLFCRHHIGLDSHSCASLETNQQIDSPGPQYQNSTSPRERCAFDRCQKPTLESVIVDTTEPEHRTVAVCVHCSGAFCAVHRHPSDHSCKMIPSPASLASKDLEAHELLAKNFPPTSSTKDTSVQRALKPLTDPKKLARLRAVELMKMRHHALPADPKDKTASTPLTQRLHLKVIMDGTIPSFERIFWLRKTISTGRALDLIATHFSVRISDTTPARLGRMTQGSDAPAWLRNDKVLSEQVDDGDTLLLSVGTQT